MVNLLGDSLRSLFETGEQEDVAQRSLNPKITTSTFFMLFIIVCYKTMVRLR